MPELAELRLTADYVNKAATGLKFVNIKKNPVHKGKDVEVPLSSLEYRQRVEVRNLCLLSQIMTLLKKCTF